MKPLYYQKQMIITMTITRMPSGHCRDPYHILLLRLHPASPLLPSSQLVARSSSFSSFVGFFSSLSLLLRPRMFIHMMMMMTMMMMMVMMFEYLIMS